MTVSGECDLHYHCYIVLLLPIMSSELLDQKTSQCKSQFRLMASPNQCLDLETP